jgi:hypothetical protein
MKSQEKLKNIKDLEYSHLLNKQNIFLIVLATAIISVILSKDLPEYVNKPGLILALIFGFLLSLLYYSKKIKEKLSEIEAI